MMRELCRTPDSAALPRSKSCTAWAGLPAVVVRLAAAASATALIVARLMTDEHTTSFSHCNRDSPVLVGTHHKTGTVLLKHIFLKEVCPIMAWRCSFDHEPTPCSSAEQARAAGLQLCFLQHGVRFQVHGPQAFRFIHAIRDPMEVVLSGYQYHLKTTEKWANRPDRRYNGSSYRRYLNALSVREGLRAEVKHSARDALKTMPRLLNRTAGKECTLTLRLEDFEHDWSGTIARLWDLLGLDAATAARLDRAVAKHNVYSARRQRGYNRHVGNATTRDAMRRSVRTLPEAYAKVQAVRKRLGYPTVGREAAPLSRA